LYLNSISVGKTMSGERLTSVQNSKGRAFMSFGSRPGTSAKRVLVVELGSSSAGVVAPLS
jgi:hypothetical protein